MYEHLVVGTDGSPTATEAVRQAAELAKAFDARLTVFSAYPPPDAAKLAQSAVYSGAAAGGPDVAAEMGWQITSAAHAESVVHNAEAAARTTHAKVKRRAEPGDPADAIIRFVREEGADLIVVGSKGMTSAKRLILGSVPNKISHHAPCDVIIVRTVD